MALQNRVTPEGELVATGERGTLMGNRGVLHDEERRIVRPWQLVRWIACATEFRGRWRPVMAPRRWTELFFLDEATALAAGHRPCAQCRFADFARFQRAFAAAHDLDRPGAEAIDRALHRDRLAGRRGKRTYEAPLRDLPDGTMVRIDGAAWLVQADCVRRWSFGGYLEARPRREGARVDVLTPRSTVAALRAGYGLASMRASHDVCPGAPGDRPGAAGARAAWIRMRASRVGSRMTTAEQLEQWQGRQVVDADGVGLGKLEDVYYAASGEPVLARIGSGVIGRHHRLVPLVDSSVGRDYLRVAYRKDQIEQADVEASDEAIDPQTAATIGTRYGVALPGADTGFESAARLEARRMETAAAQERAAALEAQAARAGDDAQTTRAHADAAVDNATQAERDAAEARRAAEDARRQADAGATSIPTPRAEQP